jgi:hypothetical protein
MQKLLGPVALKLSSNFIPPKLLVYNSRFEVYKLHLKKPIPVTGLGGL